VNAAEPSSAEAPEPRTAPEPVIFRVSESIAPGATLARYGEGLNAVRAVSILRRGGSIAATASPIQVDRQGHFCRFVFPPVAPGVYALRAQTTDGQSTRVGWVNTADPRWLSEERAYPGLKMKLMGRNLHAAASGGPTRTRLRLIPTRGGKPAALGAKTIGRVSPYCIDFRLPAALPLGTYHVEARTGPAEFGRDWVRLNDASERPQKPADTILTVEPAPRDPTALALGVAWATDFNWSRVLNV
jgi:hypothetical protein